MKLSCAPLVEAGVVPVAMGGDHSITLPELRAIDKTHGLITLIHFDSHTVTNDQYYRIRILIVDSDK